MAVLDLSDVLSDPAFTDLCSVVRTAVTVGSNGRQVASTTSTMITASVQPATGRSLDVLPEAERTLEAIKVYTTFALQGVSDAAQADEIVWRGRNWRVSRILDYGNWGSGYTQALCVLKTPTQP